MKKAEIILKKAALFEKLSLYGKRKDFLNALGQNIPPLPKDDDPKLNYALKHLALYEELLNEEKDPKYRKIYKKELEKYTKMVEMYGGDYLTSYKESKETENLKNRERKANRGLVDLATTILGQKINTRPSEIKRSQEIKKQFEAKLLEFETSKFAKYERAIELAHEKVMNATTTIAQVEAERQLKIAKTNLVKAQLAIKDQLDPVQKIKEYLEKLRTIQKMVKELIKAGIIDNNGLLQPDKTSLVRSVVEQGYSLLSEYPFQDKIEALVAKELLDKLAKLVNGKTEETPEANAEEPTPADIDLTEKLSFIKAGPIMNKKSRRKLLEKIEKQALQQTSFQDVMNKIAPVDMNLPSNEYAKQVYISVSHAVAETIDDDLDKLIQELEADNQ